MACAPCLFISLSGVAPLSLSLYGTQKVLQCKKCNKMNCNCKKLKNKKKSKKRKSKKIMYQL